MDVDGSDRRRFTGTNEVQGRKSRSLVIKKGQTIEKFKLYVQNEEIPSIVASPIKCLGKWFDASLHDRNNFRKLERWKMAARRLIAVDYMGSSKLGFTLLPRLIWPLMLYEVPSNSMEALERITSRHLRKWLEYHQALRTLHSTGRLTNYSFRSLH